MMNKKILCNLLLFFAGGVGYSVLEILWRGFTHWTMFLLGGLCYLLIIQAASACKGKLPLWFCCFCSAAAVTMLEFATGCLVNLLLGWNVWDYRGQPLNLLGQVCIGFTALWFLLSIPVAELGLWMKDKIRQSLDRIMGAAE